MARRFFLLAAAALVLAASAGCGGEIPFVGGGAPAGDPPTFVVLADNSRDAPEVLRAEAVRAVEIAARAAAAGRGSIAVATFERNALSAIAWPLSHRFQPSEALPQGNSFYAERDLERQAQEVAAQARHLFGRRRFGTDILGALIATADRLATAEPGPRVLVLVSNMLTVSPDDGLRFRRQKLTKTFVAKTLQRLERQGRIPDLEGVCVYVIGAGRDRTDGVPTSKQLELRLFWQGLFERAGARLAAWEPTLSAEPRCSETAASTP